MKPVNVYKLLVSVELNVLKPLKNTRTPIKFRLFKNLTTTLKYISISLIVVHVVFLLVSGNSNDISTGDFNIYESTKVVAILPSSLLESRQLTLSNFTTIADCALTCFNILQCFAAVYNKLSRICLLYQSSGAFRGNLISSTPDDFAIVLRNRSPGYHILIRNRDFFKPFLCRFTSNNINITVQGIWNTSAGCNSQYSYPGTGIGSYWYTQQPEKAIDGIFETTYCNHGPCSSISSFSESCGTQAGLFFTYSWGPMVLRSFRMITGFNSNRDPIWVTLEGSNQNTSFLDRGSSWTLIYNGTSGFDIDPGRQRPGQHCNISSDGSRYTSYRFLTLKKRGLEGCSEIADIELITA